MTIARLGAPPARLRFDRVAGPAWSLALRLGLLALLLLAGGGGARANEALQQACRNEASLDEGCRSALERASTADVLALVERWVAARRFAPALQALEHLRGRQPWNARITERLHEVRSVADEAAWMARREAAAASAADTDLTLVEARCTRLTGEQALAACDQVLRARPGDVRVLVARGDLLLTLGRAADALQSYRAAAAREPSAALARKITLAEAAAKPAAAPPLDQQLLALARALDQGLLTQAEYARQRAALLQSVAAVVPTPGASAPALDAAVFGRYHALVIGNNAYLHVDRLETAINDARAVGDVLRTSYGFDVRVLTDTTRADIVEVLDEYRARLREGDNLLIYYAGHGWLDAEADKGFWLPVDAHPDKRTQWVSNDTVRDALRALKAKHVLVVADSCFSGTLTRGAAAKRTDRSAEYLQRMARLKARQVLTSGGLEPVADSGGGGHSPFAAALIEALRSNPGVLDATSLFSELRRPVALRSDQVPQFADIRMAGHEGGDFLFVRRGR
ncbi:MAG: caspase family protein [Rubrivivax sp.]|nr:caspase family protein [Rubrivivax sp.]